VTFLYISFDYLSQKKLGYYLLCTLEQNSHEKFMHLDLIRVLVNINLIALKTHDYKHINQVAIIILQFTQVSFTAQTDLHHLDLLSKYYPGHK